MSDAEWAAIRTATLTKSAVTYNAGALNLAHESGCTWWRSSTAQIAAGPDTATPTRPPAPLRTIEDAARRPISITDAAERSGRAQT
ncbi:hypothetical protein [Streptomyces sp. NPDC058424]|uniref:hypothetical protein n=1 Tax=Streptomyces sp. NPDC058424 TaxID=3346491 RepID=UPI0036492585